MVIQSDMRILSLLPDHFNRWWPIWKSRRSQVFLLAIFS
jgi:hypothetical protein